MTIENYPKGQFGAHVFAVDALLAADALPPVNVKLLLEGGEESGSHGLREYLHRRIGDRRRRPGLHRRRPMHRSRRPTLVYGHRGILTLQLTHRTANTGLHSGNFGGPVPSATDEPIDSMQVEASDRIAVEGFHDGIEVTESDRELVAAIPTDEAAIRESSASHFATDRPYYERIRAHVAEVTPDVAVEKGSASPPTRTPVDVPAADAVRVARSEVWDEAVVELPVLGGNLPATFFREVDGLEDVPVLVVPYANPDQGDHAPNEHLDLDCFENGIRTTAAFLRRFAESG